MTVEERLTELIIDKYKSVRQFAMTVDLPNSTVDSIFTRGVGKANVSNIIKICDELGIQADALIKGEIIYKTEDDDLAKYGLMPPPKMKRVPRIGTVACGSPIIALDEYGEYDDVPDDVRCDCTILCKGDSMIGAEIYDGDVVYVRQQEDVENGQIAVVKIDDETTLKRVYKKEDHIILMPDNPEYEPIIVSGLELEQFRVFGKVVGLFRRIN